VSRFFSSRYREVTATEILRESEPDVVRIFLEARKIFKIEDLDQQFFEYIVREGDTFDLLAFALSGREDLWWVLAELNIATVDFPMDLTPGEIIILPYQEVFLEFLT